MLQLWDGIRKYKPLKVVNSRLKVTPVERLSRASEIPLDIGLRIRWWERSKDQKERKKRVGFQPLGGIIDIIR